MLIELLTPFIIATAPVLVELPCEAAQYSHESQQTIGVGDGPIAQYSTKTRNGTRTYDWQGKPNDSDDDSD
jgi:hypothetical protein